MLDQLRPLLAGRLEAAERIRNAVTFRTFEAARQHRGILHRHRRTLRHVRRHRMAGVAEQRHIMIGPVGERFAIDNRPFVHVGACGQYPFDLAVKTFISLAQFPDVAFRGPRLDPELRLRLAGDEVDFAAVRLDVVDDDVAVLAPPFGAIVDGLAAEQRRGIGRPVGDAAGEIHRRGAEQDVAHHGMNAVGADHGIGRGGCTIGERQPDALAGLVQPDQFVVELDAIVRHRARQRRMQITAMRQQIGRAKFLFGALAENHVELDFAGAPVAVVPGARIERLAAKSLFQPEPAQHLHGVAADLDAGAEPRELRRLLVDGDVDAYPAQRRGGGKATHAGADNRDRQSSRHPIPPRSFFLFSVQAGRNPARSSAARPSCDASAPRKACTAGRCLRAFTSAKS